MKSRFGKNDMLFLAALIVVLVLILYLFYGKKSLGADVVVTVDGKEFGRYSLSEEQQINITDAKGRITNVLLIQDGHADMIEADCPDQLCVHQSRISHENENIVCLPNKVVVTVVGGETSDLDAVAK